MSDIDEPETQYEGEVNLCSEYVIWRLEKGRKGNIGHLQLYRWRRRVPLFLVCTRESVGKTCHKIGIPVQTRKILGDIKTILKFIELRRSLAAADIKTPP